MIGVEQEHMELEKRYRELTDLLVCQTQNTSFTHDVKLLWSINYNGCVCIIIMCVIVLQANAIGSHGQ